MPLNRTGRKLRKIFEKEYGKREGDRIFYGWENKHKKIIEKLKKHLN